MNIVFYQHFNRQCNFSMYDNMNFYLQTSRYIHILIKIKSTISLVNSQGNKKNKILSHLKLNIHTYGMQPS